MKKKWKCPCGKNALEFSVCSPECAKKYMSNLAPPTESWSWEERLQFEIMEDYLTVAKMGHFAKDQKAHMEEMRQHYGKLVAFISLLLQEEREAINRKIEAYFKGLIFVPDPQATLKSLLASLTKE